MTVHYSVQAGDTFRSIAADHGVTAEALALANPWVNLSLVELPDLEWNILVRPGWLLHIREAAVFPPPPPPPRVRALRRTASGGMAARTRGGRRGRLGAGAGTSRGAKAPTMPI